MKEVTMYTDGGCIGNPGPGGYGTVLLYGGHRKEIADGFKLTTNNRMELLACIAGLEALKLQCRVTVFSDSKYVVDGVEKGWAVRWRKNGWRKNNKDRAENSDLWERLLQLCGQHTVQFSWVKGHAGNVENERCDELATKAARGDTLQKDNQYEMVVRQKNLNAPVT